MRYFANANVKSQERRDKLPQRIGVSGAPESHEAIGVASEVGKTERDAIIWRLKVSGGVVEGLFVIVDGEFIQLKTPDT
jgi:hypothetical protein